MVPKTAIWSLVIICLFASTCLAQEADEETSTKPVKGCYFKYYQNLGKLDPLQFVKTADKEYGSADGDPEIWGYFPGNLGKRSSDGKFHAVNVLAAFFVPADGKFYTIPMGRGQKSVRCSAWDNKPATSASQ